MMGHGHAKFLSSQVQVSPALTLSTKSGPASHIQLSVSLAVFGVSVAVTKVEWSSMHGSVFDDLVRPFDARHFPSEPL